MLLAKRFFNIFYWRFHLIMNKSWSNTTLVAYSRIPKIVKNIDVSVKNRINSAYQSVHLKNGISNEKLIGEIIKLNDDKRKACNLVFIVETALSKLPECEKDVLTGRLCYGKTFKEISEIVSKPLRTVFRLFSSAEQKFSSVLTAMGYGEKWLEQEYSNCPLLAGIKKQLDDEKYFTPEKDKF